MATSKSHLSFLRTLRSDVGQEKLDLVCPTVIAAMDARYKFTSTRNVLSALRKEYPGCQHFIDEMKKRMSEYKKLDNSGEPTEKQVTKYVPWDKIIEFRDLYRDDMKPDQRLCMALYTYIPPVRLDYTPMLIVTRRPKKLRDGVNYCVKTKDPYFIFHAYKTAKIMGDREMRIPPQLMAEIDLYVKEGQQWLFESNGKPWTEARLSQTIRRIFLQFHNMETSVNTFRHSYATKFHAGQKPLSQIYAVADAMLHGPLMSMNYAHHSLEDIGEYHMAAMEEEASFLITHS